MKTLVFVSVVLCALIIGSVAWKTTAATDDQKRTAITQFANPVMLQGHVLKGTYLFVHDDAAMQRGEACTYIYKGEAEVREKLVTSFHCIHVERTRAKSFVTRTRESAAGMMELTEFQFSGETAGHGVPLPSTFAVVPVAN
ncbi:MAG TPA: hypothetical protein VLB87_08760 [Pyrinomonadaceae bacterium]|nr:hypothetical protein [Pyrinomonadaceae bacterium]